MAITGVSQSPYMTPVVPAAQPAGIAIEQKMLSQINGYDQGVRNGEDGQSAIQTADGALSSISDSLQRIRELGIQASNTAVYTDSDRAMMQDEVDQLRQGISDVAKYTQFNTLNLLDGSMADMQLALNPEGGGLDIKMENVTLDALGIKDFDLTGNFNLEDIDQALQKVTSARASLGAQNNALTHSISVGEISSENLTSSVARLEDLDIPAVVSEQKKKDIMQQYQYFAMQQKKQSNQAMVQKMLS